MRKFILVALVLAGQSWAQQWSPGLNITDSNFGSSWTASNQARSLTVRGDTIYLVWCNATEVVANMGHQVYFKKYDGTAWDTANTLIGYVGNWRRHNWYPSCAIDAGGNLHVVWETNDFVQISIYDIAYRRMNNNGSWSGITRVTSNAVQGYSWRPVVGCGSDGGVHLAWQDNRQGTFRIFYKSLMSGSWSNDLCLSPSGVYAVQPSLAVTGTEPAVVWQDFRDGSSQIYFKKMTGNSWGQDSAISQSLDGSYAPCLTSDDNGNLHVVWEDLRDGNFEIYYRRLSSQTQTWGPVTRLTDDPFYSRQPFLLCQGDSLVNIFWSDDREGSYEIYHRQQVNNVWQPETILTQFDGSASLCPSAAADYSGNLHLAWSDFNVWYHAPDIFYMSGIYPKKAQAENQTAIPGSTQLVLLSARPNPTNNRTKIVMMIGQSGWTRLRVYNIAGQFVKELYRGQLAGGQHEFWWDGKDGNECKVSNGMYFVRAESGGTAFTGKIMVMR